MRVLFALLTSLAIAPAATAQFAGVTSPSGLVFLSLKEGVGASPAVTDTVKVHYRGTFADGKEFESSYKRGKNVRIQRMRLMPIEHCKESIEHGCRKVQ